MGNELTYIGFDSVHYNNNNINIKIDDGGSMNEE